MADDGCGAGEAFRRTGRKGRQRLHQRALPGADARRLPRRARRRIAARALCGWRPDGRGVRDGEPRLAGLGAAERGRARVQVLRAHGSPPRAALRRRRALGARPPERLPLAPVPAARQAQGARRPVEGRGREQPRDRAAAGTEREGGAQAASPPWLAVARAAVAARPAGPGCGPKPVRSQTRRAAKDRADRRYAAREGVAECGPKPVRFELRRRR